MHEVFPEEVVVYVPALQLEQAEAPEGEYIPAGQDVHEALFGAVAKRPAWQEEHEIDDEDKVPAAQSLHEAAPAVEMKPGSQFVHFSAPAALANWPA